MTEHVDTVIVGGGIAGLTCARALHHDGHPFTLVTPRVGGRLLVSDDGKVNYGAYFVGADYEHVLPLVERGPRLLATRVGFGDDEERYSVFRSARHPGQLFALYRTLLRFGHHLRRFRGRCLTVDQPTALAADPYLARLQERDAAEYLASSGFSEVARAVLGEVVYAIGFCEPELMSAFEFLHLARYLVTVPVYAFRVLEDDLVAGFAHRVTVGRVTSVEAGEAGYRVHTDDGRVLVANTVVLATPPAVTQRLAGLPAIKPPVAAWTTHVSGRWLSGPRHDEEVFPAGGEIMAIARQPDDSAVVVSAGSTFDIDRFFAVDKVLAQHHWQPAFHLGRGAMWPGEAAPGLFIAGDHNLCGLEDAALTGLYAGNRILGRLPPGK